MGLRGRTGRTGVKRVKLCPPFDRGEPRCRGDTDSGAFAIRGTCSLLLLLLLRDHLLLLLAGSAAALPSCGLSSLPLGLSCLPSPLPPSSFLLLLLLELLLAEGGDGGGGVAKAMSAALKETKRKEREGEGERSKRKRHREERQAVQAAGEEQARKALQEKARKEREANEQLDELFRRARMPQPEPSPQCPDSWLNTTPPRHHSSSPSSISPSSSTGKSRVSECNVKKEHAANLGNVKKERAAKLQVALVNVKEERAKDCVEYKRRSQRACQHRLLLQLLVLLLLLCFVLGVLPQHYFPMDISTDIFPTRAFQVGIARAHAGVWGVLTEKIHSSKLMGLYERLWSRARCRSFRLYF